MPATSDFASSKFVVPTPKTHRYRSFLLGLDRKFKKDDLNDLKFALKDVIPKGELENLNHVREVFDVLEDRCLLGPSKLDELRGYPEAIDRPSLTEVVDDYDDAETKFPLKPRLENFLEKDGYKVSIKGVRHFDTTRGEFVEVRSGSNYSLILVNHNNHRCLVYLMIDGYEMFPNGYILLPKQTSAIERPSRIEEKFKFFAISDAPPGSGINEWRENNNGLIQVKFSPEKADMKIICVALGAESHIISCSMNVTDVEFHEMVSHVFGKATAIVMVNKWKPLGNRGIKLVEYGICDGSRVDVNLGGVGGASTECFCSRMKKGPSKEMIAKTKRRAGATTLEGKSDQQFVKKQAFPIDPCQATMLALRLVSREDEIPIPSTGNPTPLVKATLIPPPVPK